MAQQPSFDIVSQLDLQEVDNAVNQAKKELQTRYDFKGSKSTIELFKDEKKIKLVADDDLKLRNLHDILKTRMTSRKLSVKSLEFKTPEKAFEGCLRQEVGLVQGIPQDKAKEIVKAIKEQGFKVQAAIQGEEIRVSSKSKDELQAVIQHLRGLPLSIPVQFVNFR
ncbi:MAG: YajQ family cyclic di-GMP-binding protein [Candidatus Omnitrophica bacterium]|nr:YajQ family cyclic di-GMP-binding protein [Candidatus Omnitrophota bacterium]